MSKQEVLSQVYPDELEYIFRKKRDREIKRYDNYRHMMIAIAAGFGAETESGEPLYKVYSQQLDAIIAQMDSAEPVKEKKYTPEDIDGELDKLRGLQGVINQTKARKR